MEKFIQKICNDIIEQYKQDKNVLGIMIFGSAAKNKFDRYSDIDFYVLLKKKNKYSRLNFIRSQVRIDIISDTVGMCRTYLKKDQHSVRRNT